MMLEISDAYYTVTNTMTRLSGADQMPIARLFRFKHMHATQTHAFTLQVYVGMRDHEMFIQYLEELRMDTWAMVRGSNDEPTPRRFRSVYREGTLNSCQCVIREIEYDDRIADEGHFPRLASINVELLDHLNGPTDIPRAQLQLQNVNR